MVLLYTNDNQFAYKKGHSTDICIYLLKEALRFYTKHCSPIYVCFLDASKAFDKLNHWILFKKLKQRGCPVYLVKCLGYWYQKKILCVKWANYLSDTFSVSNGIKPGGLSPMFFNIYIDDLSTALNKCNVGCYFNAMTRCY